MIHLLSKSQSVVYHQPDIFARHCSVVCSGLHSDDWPGLRDILLIVLKSLFIFKLASASSHKSTEKWICVSFA